jgi:AbrB family looped-hinge helix DNA binding protein
VVPMKGPKGMYAWTVTVGEKGQIVIPKQAREIFDIRPGDALMLLADEKQGIAIPPKAMFASLMSTVFSGKDSEE